MSRQWAVALVAVMFLMVCLTGCAQVRNSLHSALEDVTDIARLDVSGSIGTDMGAHVMITKYAQLKSYSYEDLYRVGIDARHIGIWTEERDDWWVGTLHAKNMNVKKNTVFAVGGPSLLAKMRSEKRPFWFLMESDDEVGFGAHFLVAGFRVGVRPFELLDLFSNFVGMDICNDNVSWEERRAWRAVKEAAKQKKKLEKESPKSKDAKDPAL